jgi:hypothetical protein
MPLRRTRDSLSYANFLEEQRQAEDAQRRGQEEAEAEQQRPLIEARIRFTEAANASAEAQRQRILTQRLSEQEFPGERVNGRELNPDTCSSIFKSWAARTSTFRNEYADAFLDFFSRNDLVPSLDAFDAVHRLLLEWACYPETPAPVQQVAVRHTPDPQPTPSELAAKAREARMTTIVVTDPATGIQYTEHALSLLPSRDELRLRRIAEKGHAGSAAADAYWEMKDENAAEIARLTEESQ